MTRCQLRVRHSIGRLNNRRFRFVSMSSFCTSPKKNTRKGSRQKMYEKTFVYDVNIESQFRRTVQTMFATCWNDFSKKPVSREGVQRGCLNPGPWDLKQWPRRHRKLKGCITLPRPSVR